jgi:glycosyltransferase involved in cell wall biosynthesis
MPAVSVLMPCYNAADTLAEALDSLDAQTLVDFEVVIVDDGSTDATRSILANRAARDRRLRLLFQPHGGILAALNAGLKACQADFIARLDSDDKALPHRLERQLAWLVADPAVAVVSCLVAGFPPENLRRGYQVYIDWLNSLVTDADICRQIFVESPLVHPSVMFRRAWVESLGGYQEHGWPEDYDLWLRLYLAGGRFAKVPEVLLEWRESPGRLTRTDSRYSLENFLRAKAHYLARGPAAGRDAVFLWGAGMQGRRLSKHLLRQGLPLVCFVDIDPGKIGNTRRGLPIISPADLPGWWRRYRNPVLFSAVGSHGARPLVAARIRACGLQEGQDWWHAA